MSIAWLMCNFNKIFTVLKILFQKSSFSKKNSLYVHACIICTTMFLLVILKLLLLYWTLTYQRYNSSCANYVTWLMCIIFSCYNMQLHFLIISLNYLGHVHQDRCSCVVIPNGCMKPVWTNVSIGCTLSRYLVRSPPLLMCERPIFYPLL